MRLFHDSLVNKTFTVQESLPCRCGAEAVIMSHEHKTVRERSWVFDGPTACTHNGYEVLCSDRECMYYYGQGFIYKNPEHAVRIWNKYRNKDITKNGILTLEQGDSDAVRTAEVVAS